MSSKVFLLVLLDILTIQIASFLGLFIRYEFSFNSIPVSDMEQVLHYTIPNTIITLIVFAIAKMYRGVWRHASSSELVNIILGNAVASVIQVTCAYMLKLTLPRSSYLIYYFAMVIGTSCVRFSYVIDRIHFKYIGNQYENQYRKDSLQQRICPCISDPKHKLIDKERYQKDLHNIIPLYAVGQCPLS